MRRLLVAVVVGLGLFAMHGLAAPSAQAAHCGALPGHVHVEAPFASTEVTSEATLLTTSGSGAEQGLWLTCVAILAGLLLIAAVRRLTGDLAPCTRRPSAIASLTRSGRSPPTPGHEDLCVWRT
jgi:hypothetical protein